METMQLKHVDPGNGWGSLANFPCTAVICSFIPLALLMISCFYDNSYDNNT